MSGHDWGDNFSSLLLPPAWTSVSVMVEGCSPRESRPVREVMNDDNSNHAERGTTATVLAGAPAKAEDMSRFESEGGRIAPEQRTDTKPSPGSASWKQVVLEYQKPSTGRALWQTV